MKMDLIQPFINAADAVLAETLGSPTHICDLSMEEQAYRRKGVAAMIAVEGDIEGRVICDMEPQTAVAVASALAGLQLSESADLVRETILELTNLVTGNAVTQLNDRGFRFKVLPPSLHDAAEGPRSSKDTEALVMCFETAKGRVFLNIAMRYNHHGAAALV